MAQSGCLRVVSPRWSVRGNAVRKIVLRQRWKERMDGNARSASRFSNPPSLLLFLRAQERNGKQFQIRTTFFLTTRIRLFFSRHGSGSRLLFVLRGAPVPSCLDLLAHLSVPIGLQCLLLILSQLAEVHSLCSQLPGASHHLLRPHRVSRRF